MRNEDPLPIPRKGELVELRHREDSEAAARAALRDVVYSVAEDTVTVRVLLR
jgi:hypothetical protein